MCFGVVAERRRDGDGAPCCEPEKLWPGELLPGLDTSSSSACENELWLAERGSPAASCVSEGTDFEWVSRRVPRGFPGGASDPRFKALLLLLRSMPPPRAPPPLPGPG